MKTNPSLLRIIKGKCGAVLVSMALGLASASGSVVYQELFPGSTNNQPLSSTGWSGYIGTGAYDASNVVGDGSSPRMGVSNLTGNPSSDGLGYGFSATATGGRIFLSFTDEYGFSPAATTAEWSWMQYSSSTTVTIRLAVRIGGNWYASDTAFTSAAGTAAQFPDNGESKSLTFTTDAVAWRDVTFTAGSELGLAASARVADLPSGDITAFGFFHEIPGSNNTARYDTLKLNVTPVPEPGSVALLAAAFFGIACHTLRRRTS